MLTNDHHIFPMLNKDHELWQGMELSKDKQVMGRYFAIVFNSRILPLCLCHVYEWSPRATTDKVVADTPSQPLRATAQLARHG